jgi:glycylpeptide N-tetradecanoyltransferase
MPPKKGRKRGKKKQNNPNQAFVLPGEDAAGAGAGKEDIPEGDADDLDLVSEDAQLELSKRLGGMTLPQITDISDDAHKFWDTQPVSKLADEFTHGQDVQGPLDEPKTVADVRKEPYVLSELFEWAEVDVGTEPGIAEIYDLLNGHYVEDDDNMFRFDYSRDFLRWALQPPGWRRDWIVGVRLLKTKKLVAFISAVPATIVVYGRPTKMVEINFLCVHQKLRDKRLAPILIKEITRRVNLQDIWQASFTAGKVLPRPISRSQYHHRNLNPKKLIAVKFSHLGPNMTMARTIKLFRLPDKPQLQVNSFFSNPISLFGGFFLWGSFF